MNDRLLGSLALLLAACITWAGWGLQAPFAYEPVGPRAFPLLLALIIGLCGLRLAFKGGNPVSANPASANGRIALMLLFSAGYALLFQWLGFVLSTAFMVVAVGRLFGGSWRNTLIAGVVMGLLFFLLFDKLLDVVLPGGLLGQWI